MGLDFKCWIFGVCRSKGCKVTSCQSWRSYEKSASRPRPQSASLPVFDSRSRSNHSQSLMAGNFAALWPTDPKFLALKYLNPFKTVSKFQRTSSILRVGFTLSKWPHFNSGCLLRVPYSSGIAVFHIAVSRKDMGEKSFLIISNPPYPRC